MSYERKHLYGSAYQVKIVNSKDEITEEIIVTSSPDSIFELMTKYRIVIPSGFKSVSITKLEASVSTVSIIVENKAEE